jgi:hypothetical protein
MYYYYMERRRVIIRRKFRPRTDIGGGGQTVYKVGVGDEWDIHEAFPNGRGG